jgi:probable phosphoglycerate mutase
MKKNKLVYIVRHGETDFNKLGIVQKRVDTDLNETGLLQAKQFFDYYKNIDFDKVYVSALKRTKQSVQSFIDEGIPFEILPELNEISWGDFEGKVQDFKEREFYQKAVSDWNSGNYDTAVAQGETPNQLQARQRLAVQKILAASKEKTI